MTFFNFCFFRAAPVAYAGSQARGSNPSCNLQPMPKPQQCQIQATSATYTTAHGNTRSLTHWARPGIEPATSCLLVGFVSPAPRWELRHFFFFLIEERELDHPQMSSVYSSLGENDMCFSKNFYTAGGPSKRPLIYVSLLSLWYSTTSLGGYWARKMK